MTQQHQKPSEEMLEQLRKSSRDWWRGWLRGKEGANATWEWEIRLLLDNALFLAKCRAGVDGSCSGRRPFPFQKNRHQIMAPLSLFQPRLWSLCNALPDGAQNFLALIRDEVRFTRRKGYQRYWVLVDTRFPHIDCMVHVDNPMRSLEACHRILFCRLPRKSRLDQLQELLDWDRGLPRRNLSLSFLIDFAVLRPDEFSKAIVEANVDIWI